MLGGGISSPSSRPAGDADRCDARARSPDLPTPVHAAWPCPLVASPAYSAGARGAARTIFPWVFPRLPLRARGPRPESYARNPLPGRPIGRRPWSCRVPPVAHLIPAVPPHASEPWAPSAEPISAASTSGRRRKKPPCPRPPIVLPVRIYSVPWERVLVGRPLMLV